MLNGPGVRLVLWFRGCGHHCPECHNPETWSFEPQEGDLDAMHVFGDIVNELEQTYYSGVTLTGGCPFCQDHEMLRLFLKGLKEVCPTKTIWCWAGERYEDLVADALSRECLKYIDVLVDGPYVKALRHLSKYSGSTNQRVIDVQASLQNNKVIKWEEPRW